MLKFLSNIWNLEERTELDMSEPNLSKRIAKRITTSQTWHGFKQIYGSGRLAVFASCFVFTIAYLKYCEALYEAELTHKEEPMNMMKEEQVKTAK